MPDSPIVTPANPPPTGTVDVTNLVETLRSAFVTWSSTFIYAAAVAVPGMFWLAWPVISTIFKAVLNWILNTLSKAAVMEAFFFNTAVRKASQAQDFVDAVTFKNNLPPTATNEEYANAEKSAMAAFRNFVLLTN